ncbi:Hypothetical protein A7982_03132 [Minicystis rosea]|nr:Hypothetical protein A7982_03132 [Minicystis rosea]
MDGTVDRWAFDYVTAVDLAHKLAPPAPPRVFVEGAAPLRLDRPGRPPELEVSARAPKTPGPDAMRAPERRASLVHTFLHHELQAAELMCWAILAFPDAPEAFRLGLLGIARDEIRHMAMYGEHLAALGSRVGAFPVRDWFWQRIPNAASPAHFVASFGMGLEAANLDHAARFTTRFEAVGDDLGAAIEARIGAEEIPHVRFALHWFERFTGAVTFETWTRHLPPPLSPLLMAGAPLNREARIAAGFPPDFVDALAAWQPESP